MIPKEVDELMWSVVESNDPEAISEFGDRYPNLREELLKRMRTVQALKAGKQSLKSTKIPTFRNPQTAPTNWRLVYTTFGIAVLAMCAFGLWKLNASAPASNQPSVQAINVDPPKTPPVNLPNNNNVPTNPMPANGEHSGGTTNPAMANNAPEGIDPESKRTDLQLESAPLQAVILLVCEAGKLQCTIAPGMPNPKIRVDFRDMTPMDMLKVLGQQYAFSTLMDGDHAVMVIPKKDEDDNQMTNETR